MKNAGKVTKMNTMKRGLALLIALMLAMPGFTYAEAPVTVDTAHESDPSSGEKDAPVEE